MLSECARGRSPRPNSSGGSWRDPIQSGADRACGLAAAVAFQCVSGSSSGAPYWSASEGRIAASDMRKSSGYFARSAFKDFAGAAVGIGSPPSFPNRAPSRSKLVLMAGRRFGSRSLWGTLRSFGGVG